MLKDIIAKFGALNVLVNNAGVAPKVRTDVLDMTEESYDRVMGINLKGPYFLTQAVANRMIAWQAAGVIEQARIVRRHSSLLGKGGEKVDFLCGELSFLCRVEGKVPDEFVPNVHRDDQHGHDPFRALLFPQFHPGILRGMKGIEVPFLLHHLHETFGKIGALKIPLGQAFVGNGFHPARVFLDEPEHSAFCLHGRGGRLDNLHENFLHVQRLSEYPADLADGLEIVLFALHCASPPEFTITVSGSLPPGRFRYLSV